MSIDGPHATRLLANETLSPYHCLRFQPVGDRRDFLRTAAFGFGASVLGTLMARDAVATDQVANNPLAPRESHFPAKAKRVIFMHMAGAPSHIDLFEHKPQLEKLRGTDLPPSVRNGQRITGFTSGQKTLPVAPAHWPFKMCGPAAMPISDLLTIPA